MEKLKGKCLRTHLKENVKGKISREKIKETF